MKNNSNTDGFVEKDYKPVDRLLKNFEIHDVSSKEIIKEFLVNIVFKVKYEEIQIQSKDSYNILKDLFEKILTKNKSFTIILEKNYIDKVYRDSYYFYYSGKYSKYERNCRRLIILEDQVDIDSFFTTLSDKDIEKKLIGSIVLRPLVGRELGRTLLDPRKLFSDSMGAGYVRLTKYHIHIFGHNLSIQAFPYCMQDSETISCAEVTILNLIDYFSETYQEYCSILPSTIIKISEELDCERRIPTNGLTFPQMSTILAQVGFYPILYRADKLKDRKFKRTLHYYIESGIPVGIGLTKENGIFHSIIGIGHGSINKSKEKLLENLSVVSSGEKKEEGIKNDFLWISDVADLMDSYCVIDDNREPYSFYTIKDIYGADEQSICQIDGHKAYYLMVPLYKKMYLEASDAFAICQGILSDKYYGIKKAIQYINEIHEGVCDIELGKKTHPVVTRLFMASSRTFRNVRVNQFKTENTMLQLVYSLVVLPKFVWVCELYSPDSYTEDKAIGELVLDATAAPSFQSNSVIIIHYPGQIVFKDPESMWSNKDFDEMIIIDDWESFDQFKRNLIPI